MTDPEAVAGGLLFAGFIFACFKIRKKIKTTTLDPEGDYRTYEEIAHAEVYEGPSDIPYPEHPIGAGPLDVWRRERMGNVVNIPTTVLLNGVPIVDGDLLTYSDGSGRQIKVLSAEPDENNGILVQENYRADPTLLGCTIQPSRVHLDLSPEEAAAILKLANSFQQQQPVSDDTKQLAKAALADLTQEKK